MNKKTTPGTPYEARLARILDIADDAIISIDGKQHITLFNQGAERIFGYTADEILGKPLETLLPSRFVAGHRDHVREFGSSPETARMMGQRREIFGRRKNGDEFPAEASISKLEAGEQVVFTVILRDISERRRALAAVEAAQARLAGILDVADDAIISVNDEQNITLFNQGAEKIFGYTASEVFGKPLDMLLPIRFLDIHRQHLREFASSSEAARKMGERREIFGKRRDGSEFPAEASISKLHIGGERIFTVILRDITERKHAEEALAQQAHELARSNAELQQFAYVASHDLQEPLRMVSSYTQLLAKRYQGRLDGDADEYIHFAVEGATRMSQLISDLLAYSRVTSQEHHPEPVDVSTVVTRALENLRVAIEESRAEVAHSGLPVIIGDELQLGQLFQNLIGNALKFRGPDSPRIDITAREREEEWEFCVRDNGIGIEPQHLYRVFQLFQRLQKRGDYPGTGIGLTICKKIVEGHGGKIWAESDGKSGSAFLFTMPKRR